MDNLKNTTTLIIGKTLSNALTQLNNVYQKYREYGIKIVTSLAFSNTIQIDFSNNETMLITSFENMKNSHILTRFNNIYFDKELPQDEFFDFINPFLKSPGSMWQF